MRYYGITINNDYLAHHGVKGQRWGVRHEKEKSGKGKSPSKKNLRIRKAVKIGALFLAGAAAVAFMAHTFKSINRSKKDTIKIKEKTNNLIKESDNLINLIKRDSSRKLNVTKSTAINSMAQRHSAAAIKMRNILNDNNTSTKTANSDALDDLLKQLNDLSKKK